MAFFLDLAVPDLLDEDLLQARVGDLEARHPFAARQRGREDRFGSVPVGDVHLDVVLAAPRHRDAGDLVDPACALAVGRGAIGLVHREAHDLPAHAPLHLAQLARLDDPPAIDDGDRLAELLDLLHLVRAEDERLAPVAHLEERLLEQLDVHRVEAAERLVHDQDGGVVKDRGDELDLLLIALGELLDLPVAVLGHAEPLEPILHLGGRRALRHAVQRGEEAQHIDHLHAHVEAALLREVAPRAARQAVVRATLPGDAPRIGAQDVEDDAHAGGLARAIGAEQPKDAPRLDGEAHPVEGAHRPERLADGVDHQAHGCLA